jgi:uncharacterized protein (DUF1499 family)
MEEPAVKTDSHTARISIALAAAAIAAFAVGPALAQLGAASAFVAFRVFGVGLLLSLLALLFGCVGWWRTRPSAERGGRAFAIGGVLLGALPLAVVAAVAGSAGNAPVINDITTNPDDPPLFRAAQAQSANAGRDLSYPHAEFAAAQRAGYPDLAPIGVMAAPEVVYGRCLTAARELGWQVTVQDRTTHSFEAIDVTRVFRFVDDIAVRVRGDGGASAVDVRSKSRDGKGDMGANAARIRAFRDAIASSDAPVSRPR